MLEALLSEKIYRISEKIRNKYYFNEDKVDIEDIISEQMFKNIDARDREQVIKVQHRLVEEPYRLKIKMKLIAPDYVKEFELYVSFSQYGISKNSSSKLYS